MNEDTDKMTNFEKVIEIAKKVKGDWVEKTDRGDMPPTIFVERGDKVVAIVMAPQVDRNAGLKAAAACRAGFRATAITMILDAHVRMEQMPEGTNMQEAKEEFLKTYKHGDMQKACDEEGACERGEIADVLVIHRMDDAGKMKMHMMPYAYHGKGGAPFKWLEDHPAAEMYNKKHEETDDPTKYEGYIVETLAEIMKQPALLDRDDEFINLIKKAGHGADLDPERQLYHTGRAILRLLQSDGFNVIDCQEPPPGVKHEPIEPLEPNVSLRDLIPDDVGHQIGALLRERGEEPTFRDELYALLKPHQEAINANALKFGIDEAQVSAESIADGIAHSLKHMKKAKLTQPKPPFKVKVWNGDQSEYLGEGTYVGDVPVYFIAMPDGSIRSASNAEEKPNPELVAEMGGEIIEAGENPKIVMDKEIEPGRNVVYGCQVWWQPADGGEEHQHDDHCGCGHDH